ncbi:MAG: tRNA (adenosine(37)-N6)-dimethylallyltransferase MiaA [Alphaproteobacteria bacterium]|nr:tRNA (adenosine(37)-N6)-dimethylallyltransferase MiaA [Alphaproteobacteria bacterium]
MTSGEQPVIVIAGPTATGKSRLALAVARKFIGTIINADSMQVYRDLRVLTARPSDDEMALVPHRLYGEIDAAESCSAGRWRDLALIEIARARREQRVPVLVGGTGLYLSALLEGIAEIPAVQAAVVAEARTLHARLGGEEFRRALAALDPVTAAKLPAADTQRLVRAFAVVCATGVALSEWQRRQAPHRGPSAAAVILLPLREALYAAIDRRLERMFASGAIDEVRALYARQLPNSLPAMKAVGVREIGHYLAGECSRDAALAAAQQATRRYAKRQYTWFRNRLRASNKLRKMVADTQFSEKSTPEIFSFIRQFLLTESK